MAFLAEQSKNLLKRSIKHTEIHNRAWEERKMWEERKIEKDKVRKTHHKSRHRSRSPNLQKACTSKVPSFPKVEDLKWTKKLFEFESSVEDRWQHDGFKELHPELFNPKPRLDIEIVSEIFKTDKSKIRTNNTATINSHLERKGLEKRAKLDLEPGELGSDDDSYASHKRRKHSKKKSKKKRKKKDKK